MDILARSGDSVKRLWAGLNGPQRFVLALAAVLMVFLLVWGSSSAAGEAWQKVAGHEVGDAERAEVLKALAQKKVPYEVRGGEIYVRKVQADKVVLELAGDGALSGKAMEEWLKTSDVFATSWDKNKRYQIALQRKLEFMIRQVETVRNASVQISQASEAQQIGFQGPKASASVQVELKPGAGLSLANVKAIAGVVSHAVPGLDPDRVHLMDTQGRAYRIPKADEFSGGADGIREIEARLEAEVKAKIAELFDHARIVVRAFARSKGERVESVQRSRPVPVHERTRSVIKDAGTAASAGVAKGVNDLFQDPASERKYVEKEDEARYAHDEKRMWSSDPAGQIERITVGVLLPRMVDAQSKPVGNSPPMEEVRKLAMMASGAKLEDVTVVALDTRAPEPIPAADPAESALGWLLENWTRIALAFLALFALLVVAFAIRGALPREEVEEIKAVAARLGEPLREAALADPLRPEGDAVTLRRGIQEAVDRDPDEAAAALRTWVAGR